MEDTNKKKDFLNQFSHLTLSLEDVWLVALLSSHIFYVYHKFMLILLMTFFKQYILFFTK